MTALIARVTNPLEIPRRLRALVRARESSLILLAVVVGVLGGLVVAAMGTCVDLLHEMLFHLEPGERLSARFTLDPVLAISVPLLGGLLFGIGSEIAATKALYKHLGLFSSDEVRPPLERCDDTWRDQLILSYETCSAL